LTSAAAWPVLLIALLIWGFAPGLVVRVLSLAFWHDDPRRAEMRGELDAVPRWERPFWVAQQVEVAICEGLGARLRWAAAGRIIDRWHLASGVERNRMYPDTFEIPDEGERAQVEPGDRVKLVFETRHGPAEKMWVTVVGYGRRGRLVGTLDNNPVFMPRLYPDDRIKFRREHIVDVIWWDADPADRPEVPVGSIDACVCCGEHVHMTEAEYRVLEGARKRNELPPGN
jgi:uncharacterized protein YegJ (DUF2314 family)